MLMLGEILERKGVSQKELADAMGKSDSTINTWVSGLRKPSFEQVIEVADYLGCSLDELAGREAPTRTLSEFERKMIDVYSSANAEGRKNIEMMIDYVGDNPKFRKKSDQVQTA